MTLSKYPIFAQRRAFTLVELLVVMVIVAILAGSVFVVANRSKQSALSAKTINNLREIGVASGLWSADNNSFYPFCWDQSTNRSYAQLLDPYMHGIEENRTAESRFIGPDKRIPVTANQYSHPITYSANRAICKDGTPVNGVAARLLPMSRVDSPGDVILFADGCQNPGNLGQANASAYKMAAQVLDAGTMAKGNNPIPIGPDEDTATGDGWFRYPGGKCHVVFCDGSAKAIPKGKILNRNIWSYMLVPAGGG